MSNVTRKLGFDSGSRGRGFFLLYNKQTSSGTHPACIQWVALGCFPKVKELGNEATHSHISNVNINNVLICIFTSPCLHGFVTGVCACIHVHLRNVMFKRNNLMSDDIFYF
jgi:hypothetical protein